MRAINHATGVNPFDAARVADVGDVRFSRVFDNAAATADIEAFRRRIVEAGAMPLAAGGNHSITYPIFRALASPEAPIGMIHIDAHTDTWGPFRGEKFHHGAPFRLAAEDGLLDPTRTIHIGIRGAQNWGDGCRSAPDDPCMNFVVHLGKNWPVNPYIKHGFRVGWRHRRLHHPHR